jgi:UDP-2,3-diacylglucosamine hydrolase
VPRVLLISDLHLSAERPATNERFLQFLRAEAPRADALYMLGDLFEYWIGDDDLDEPFNASIAGALRGVTQAGVRLFLMHGNRDFLIGGRFCAEVGGELLPDPHVAELAGTRTLLMHGDTLCTDDHDYQAWRTTAHSSEWQKDFLAKPLGERRKAILALRERSKEVISAKPPEIMDVNEAAVRQAFLAHRVARLIHGHTHRPARHAVELEGARGERWVLPDWYGPGGFLAVEEAGAQLVRF